ncbi:MAG: response regulator [Clostridium sp.]|nr:response regulator [Clostridium sp.]
MKVIWEKGRRKLLIGVMGVLLAFLVFSMYTTYSAYTQMVVQQQQQHLLLISRAVSKNMELSISEQLRNVSTLTQTPGFLDALEEHYDTGETARIKEYIFSYMLSHQQGPSRMYLVDYNGVQVFHYNQYPFLEDFDESLLRLEDCARDRKTGIGTVFPISPHHYGMTLLNSVYGGSGYLGTVVSVIDMETLYQQFAASLDVDHLGYVAVKDAQGTLIMHPDSRMTGFNYRRDIEDFGEMPQYESLDNMLVRQYRYEEGSAIYQSFSGGILPPDKEIASFSRMNLGGTSWYISAVMPYQQAVRLETVNLKRFGLLFTAVILVLGASGMIIYSLLRNRQKLKLETKYLKEINSTLEELHRSREEARHYQKLTTIGTLAGGIAHEFNNLLTPIIGYSEFLREQMGKDNEFYEDIEEIHKAGTRAKEIVEQILPFSRKETDVVEFASISLDVVIRDAMKTIRLIMPSNIQLREQLDDGEVNVYGNATQLHQILLNLFSNACQAMDANGGTLTVITRPLKREALPEGYKEMADTDYVEIVVEDTGCGMSREVQAQIFNPFFTTKDIGEGTGLGLSVVKNILINHGGFIRVESELERGSRFCIYLPVTASPASVAAAVQEAAGRDAPRAEILLIDDEERVVKYLKKRLERKGYHVDGYTKPEEALNEIISRPDRWNVVIMDHMMPQYKGTVLAQRIKKLKPSMGMIMITGLVEKDALEMRQEKILDSILIKPVDFDELLAAIERSVPRLPGVDIL